MNAARRKESRCETAVFAISSRFPCDNLPRSRKLAQLPRRWVSHPRCRACRELPAWLACPGECYMCSNSTALPIRKQINLIKQLLSYSMNGLIDLSHWYVVLLLLVGSMKRFMWWIRNGKSIINCSKSENVYLIRKEYFNILFFLFIFR